MVPADLRMVEDQVAVRRPPDQYQVQERYDVTVRPHEHRLRRGLRTKADATLPTPSVWIASETIRSSPLSTLEVVLSAVPEQHVVVLVDHHSGHVVVARRQLCVRRSAQGRREHQSVVLAVADIGDGDQHRVVGASGVPRRRCRPE